MDSHGEDPLHFLVVEGTVLRLCTECAEHWMGTQKQVGSHHGFQIIFGEVPLSPWAFWPPCRCTFPRCFGGRTSTPQRVSHM